MDILNIIKILSLKLQVVDWRIKGPVEEVRESNFKSILFSSTDIKNLNLYLPNLLQFHQP